MKTNIYRKAFGVALAKLRIERRWSQEFLSFEAELTRTYISLLERGLRSPTLDTIMSLCRALDISLLQLAFDIEVALKMQAGEGK